MMRHYFCMPSSVIPHFTKAFRPIIAETLCKTARRHLKSGGELWLWQTAFWITHYLLNKVLVNVRPKQINKVLKCYSPTPKVFKESMMSGQDQPQLKRKLGARHLNMTAIGGSIGTGLYLIRPHHCKAGPVVHYRFQSRLHHDLLLLMTRFKNYHSDPERTGDCSENISSCLLNGIKWLKDWDLVVSHSHVNRFAIG